MPSWFPGASFQRQAAVYSKEYGKLESIPHAWAKNEIVSEQQYFQNIISYMAGIRIPVTSTSLSLPGTSVPQMDMK